MTCRHRRPRSADRRRPLVARGPAKGRRDYEAGHIPGAVFSTSTPTSPRRPDARAAIPCPRPRRSPHGSRGSGSATRRRRGLRRRRGDDRRAPVVDARRPGPSRASPCSTAGSRPGRRRRRADGGGARPGPGRLHPGRQLVADDRRATSSRPARQRRAHRRPCAGRAIEATPSPSTRSPATSRPPSAARAIGNLGPDGRFQPPEVLRARSRGCPMPATS